MPSRGGIRVYSPCGTRGQATALRVLTKGARSHDLSTSRSVHTHSRGPQSDRLLAPAVYPVFWGLIRTKPEDRDWDAINAGRDRLAAAFAILDRHLAGRDYVGGTNFTAADIPVGVVAYRWFEMDIKREDYPDLKQWYDRLGQLSEFREHVMSGLA